MLLASVLNPPPKTTGKYATPSIMPFLARTSQNELDVGGLMRPRMPVIREAKTSAYNREVDSDEDFEKPLSNHHSEFTTDQQLSHNLLRPVINGSGTENDILDRLEDSIEHRAVSPSKVETPKITTINQPPIAPVSHKVGVDFPNDSLNQSSKRASEAVEVNEELESRKRLRGSEPTDLESELLPQPDCLLVQSTIDTSTSTHVVVEPETVIAKETRTSATAVDKGKGKAVDDSPRRDHISVSRSGNADVDGDDESDSDMPPLYLKTTDSEAEEDDDDDEIM